MRAYVTNGTKMTTDQDTTVNHPEKDTPIGDPTFDFAPFEEAAPRQLTRWFWLQWCLLLGIGFGMLSILSGGFANMRDFGWTEDGTNMVLLFSEGEKIFYLGLLAMFPFVLFLVIGLEDVFREPLARVSAWLKPIQRRRLYVGLMIALTGFLVFGTVQWVTKNRPITDDERVYWFQTRILSSGQLTLPSLPDEEPLRERIFEDNIFMVNNGKIFGQYPVGHSLALLPGYYLHYRHLMPILFAMLSVLGMYLLGAKIYGPKTGLAATALLTISPMFLATSATLLSHTSTMCFLIWFFYFAYRTWKEDAWWPAVGAGLTFLLAFQTRSTTALMVGGPAGIALAFALFRHARRHWLKIVILAVLVGAALAITFYFNYQINGEILKTNYHAAWGEGKTPFKHPFGFGKGAWHMVHTPEQGFWSAVNNLLRLNWWLFGWPLGLIFVVAWALRRDKRVVEHLGFAAFALSFLVYFFYFWPGVSDTGPVLYCELAPILILLSVRGIAAAPRLLLSWMPRHAAQRRVTLFVVFSCLTAFFTFHQFNARALATVSDNVGELERTLTQYGVPEKAVIFTNYYLKNTTDENFQDSWAVGRPFTDRRLGDERLYYVNYGKERNVAFLKKHHPDMPAYVVSWTTGGTPEAIKLEEYPILSLPDNFPDSR